MQSKFGFSLNGLLRLVFLAGLIFASSTIAMAADNSGLGDAKEEITLSPASEKIEAQPGSVQSGELTVLNTGEKEFAYTIYARPYSVETEAYKPNYSDTPSRSSLYRWVQFDSTEGKLAPGEQKKIPYTISVPADTEAGGHYGVLFVETVPDEDDEQIIARNKRVGSIVRLSVGGDIERSGAVESQSISWLQTRPPMSAEGLVSNAGNVDFDAESTLVVTTIFGRELYRASALHAVYPEKPRQIVTSWEDSPVFGLYKVKQDLVVLGETSSKSSYVLMIPRWALMLLAMAVIGGGVYVAYRRTR